MALQCTVSIKAVLPDVNFDSNEAVGIMWKCPKVCSSGLGTPVDGHFIIIVGSFCCHVLFHFPGAVTETPALPPQVVSPNVAVGESSSTQLYLVLGAVVGGLLFLVLVFLIVFIFNRQRNNNSHSSQSEFMLKITAVNTIICTVSVVTYACPL